jgi:hypothetical protein
MKGAEKSACKKAAKADKDKAIAEAKASRKTVATNTAPATAAPKSTPGK